MSDPQAVRQLEFVQEALYSLNFCAVRVQDYLREWLVPVYSQWYAPLVVGSEACPLATVFDLAFQLVKPGIGFQELPPRADGTSLPDQRFRRYQQFLRGLHEQPLMERARQIWETACRAERVGARREVGRLLIDALLQGLAPGCPSAERFQQVAAGQTAWTADDSAHLAECPRCAQIEADRQARREHWDAALQPAPPPAAPPLVVHAPSGNLLVLSRATRATLGELPLAIPPVDAARTPPAFWLPREDQTEELPNRVRLFMAHVACFQPEGVDELLDDAVVQACMHGPYLPAEEHQPPRRYNTVEQERTKSSLPGRVAGLTRIEVKTDLDSLLDVVPSELALLRIDETAGLQKLLEKPLVYKREREQDLVPKHRALVCFVVESGEELARAARARAAPGPPAYVFAKRQAFDLIRDLRDALERLENRADVEIDVAVFVLGSFGDDAVVHRLFRLDQLRPRQSADLRLDRFDQMVSFGGLVPGYFHRVGLREQPDEGDTETGSYEISDPQLEQFLQRYPQRLSPYHAEFIVPIGSLARLQEFVPATLRDVSAAASTRRRVMLIAVDPRRRQGGQQLLDEPAWSCAQARGLHEAALALSHDLEARPLAELRAQFVALVLGEAERHVRQRRRIEFR